MKLEFNLSLKFRSDSILNKLNLIEYSNKTREIQKQIIVIEVAHKIYLIIMCMLYELYVLRGHSTKCILNKFNSPIC